MSMGIPPQNVLKVSQFLTTQKLTLDHLFLKFMASGSRNTFRSKEQDLFFYIKSEVTEL